MNLSTKQRKKDYQAVFFDLDGTLIDPKEGITKSIQFALEKLGLPVPGADELEWCIGPPLKEAFAKLANSSSEALLNAALGYYRKRYTEMGMYEHLVYPGVEWMLSHLHQGGHRLFVATSKPEVFAVKILEYFGLAHYFEKIYGSELDGTRSDKSDLLKYILENSSIKGPSLMIGDRKFDVIAALQNNIDPLGVTYGYGSCEELTEAGAYHLCQSPNEIYHWIHS